MSAGALKRPVPRPDLDSAPYFAAAAEGRLSVPRCDDCSAFHWYPATCCPHCGSWNVSWPTLSGLGVLYTYVIVGYPLGPFFAERVPYPMGIIELNDAPGVRLSADIVDVDLSDVHIGMPLRAQFEEVAEGIGIVHFSAVT